MHHQSTRKIPLNTRNKKKKLNIRLILLSISFILLTIPIISSTWLYSKKVCVGSSCNTIQKESTKSTPTRIKNEIPPIASASTKSIEDECTSNPPDLSQTNLPKWIQSYFQFHHKTRCTESPKTKYLVILCRLSDTKCGGIADRLKPLPYYIYFANVSQRVLLIHWEKPASLDRFLIPKYLNWTVPQWLVPAIQMKRGPDIKNTERVKYFVNSTSKIVTCKVQTWDAGMLYYNQHVEAPTFNEVFHTLFHSIFTPVPKLQSLISQTMSSLHIQPNNYIAAHVRARYPKGMVRERYADKEGGFKIFSSKYRTKAIDLVRNAIYCAYKLNDSLPIYFASDSNEAVHYILHESEFVHSKVKIIGQELVEEPLHFDIKNYTRYEPEDFFPAFVDLYLIGNSKCTTYGLGGFGKFGLIMSYNYSCSFNHRRYDMKIQRCPKPSVLP